VRAATAVEARAEGSAAEVVVVDALPDKVDALMAVALGAVGLALETAAVDLAGC